MGIIEGIYSLRSLPGQTGKRGDSTGRQLMESEALRIEGLPAGGGNAAAQGVTAGENSSQETGKGKARSGQGWEEPSEKDYASLEDSLSAHGLKLKFNVDEETDIMQVEVIDSGSGKTVRKLPPDELLHLTASIKELSRGLLDRNY